MADPAAPVAKITKDDLESRLRAVQTDLDQRRDDAKSKLVPVAIGGGLLVLFIAYLLGKRVGRKTSTVVEIRRI